MSSPNRSSPNRSSPNRSSTNRPSTNRSATAPPSTDRTIDVVPVFDILDGLVVRGMGGDRSTYKPVSIGDSSSPRAIAEHLYNAVKSPTCYVADLDALSGRPLQVDLIEIIAELPWELWLDAGVGCLAQHQQHVDVVGRFVSRWIVALESLESTSSVRQLGETLGSEGIFSIDLVGGQLRTSIPELQDASVADIASLAIDAGFQSLIVLDVRQVGARGGNKLGEKLRELRSKFPNIDLISGGGIRDMEDLSNLEQTGCRHALVATALYDGKLTLS